MVRLVFPDDETSERIRGLQAVTTKERRSRPKVAKPLPKPPPDLEEEDPSDGLDEIAEVADRRSHDEAFEASGRKRWTVNKTGPGSPVTDAPTPKLRDLRFSDHLDGNER